MAFQLPTDANTVKFFGKKTADGNDAYMPVVIVGADGKTPISSTNRLTVDAQLTGRTVQEIVVFNALAITDTSNHGVFVDTANISGRKMLHVYSSLDQNVTISVYSVDNYGSSTALMGSKDISPGEVSIITATDIPSIIEPHIKFYILARCTVTPTTGSLTLELQGVQA